MNSSANAYPDDASTSAVVNLTAAVTTVSMFPRHSDGCPPAACADRPTVTASGEG